jgi:oligopeptide transport system permease protein
MLRYTLKRVARSLATLTIIVAVVFCLLRLMPVEGYFTNYEKMSPTQVENGLRSLGLKDPVPVQLARFFASLLRGDLGVSHKYRVNAPITGILGPKIAVSLRFGLAAILISLPLGMALGAAMARRRGGLCDRFGNAYIVVIQAVPNAVYFLFIQLFGSSWLGLSILYEPGRPSSMVLPIASLAMPSVSIYAMWLRRYMLDEENRDYIKLARAKGVGNAAVWFRHVFRNAVAPMAQLVPGSVLLTISGSIYVESLYSIPGMGGLLVDVIKKQDNTVVQALVVIFSAAGIAGLLLGDLLMGLVDPRISFVKKEGAR